MYPLPSQPQTIDLRVLAVDADGGRSMLIAPRIDLDPSNPDSGFTVESEPVYAERLHSDLPATLLCTRIKVTVSGILGHPDALPGFPELRARAASYVIATDVRNAAGFESRVAAAMPPPDTGGQLDAARAALAVLVALKDGPRDDTYEAAKEAAWQAARDALQSA